MFHLSINFPLYYIDSILLPGPVTFAAFYFKILSIQWMNEWNITYFFSLNLFYSMHRDFSPIILNHELYFLFCMYSHPGSYGILQWVEYSCIINCMALLAVFVKMSSVDIFCNLLSSTLSFLLLLHFLSLSKITK